MSSVALAASFGALAADLVNYTFEGGTEDTTPTGWAKGVIKAGVPVEPSIGYATTEGHTKVLAVEGDATLTVNGTQDADTEVDMLVKIVKPDEDPVVDDIPGTPQIALGVATNGTLMVYCQGANDAVFATTSKTCSNTWARVNLVFDYTNGCCKVSVDGELATSSTLGYKTPSCTTTGGAWYKLVDNTNKKIASMQIIGSTSVDDVIVQNTPMDEYAPAVNGESSYASSNNVNVPAMYFKENNLDPKNINVENTVGMTIGDAYQVGVPYDPAEKFAIASAAQNGTTPGSFKLAFPGQWSASSYTVTCSSSPTDQVSVEGVTIDTPSKTNGQNFVTITIEPDKLTANAVYFKVGR